MEGLTETGAISAIWVVRDPSPTSTMDDVLYRVASARLPYLIIGAGADLWKAENTVMYLDGEIARRDAAARFAAMRASVRKAG